MKTALFLSTLLVGVQSFAPVNPAARGDVTRVQMAQVSEDDMDGDRKKILEIQKTWTEIRHLDREEAQKTLEGEWLEAYNRYYEQYDEHMEKGHEIMDKLRNYYDPPKVEKKTKGQKRRDALARAQA